MRLAFDARALDAFKESDHPRDKDGKFGSGGGGSSSSVKSYPKVDASSLRKIGGQLGSNKAGVFQAPDGKKYYVKTGRSEAHAQNEVAASKLYNLVNTDTLKYVDAGPENVATEWQDPDVMGANKFSSEQKKTVQKDFATHCWLANWDCVGPDYQNQAIIDGKVTTVDTGGSMLFRAQGEPKGKAFGNDVTEWNTLRDKQMNPAAASIFGKMTDAQLKESVEQLRPATPERVYAVLDQYMPDFPQDGKMMLLEKLEARRQSLFKKVGLATDMALKYDERATVLDEVKHDPASGKFMSGKGGAGHHGKVKLGKKGSAEVREAKVYIPTKEEASESAGEDGIKFDERASILATDPPVSEKQRRAMYAAKEGHSTLGIPKKVGEEFVGKDSSPKAAGCLFVAKDGDVLLMRRSGNGDHEGEWALPGGMIEEGETATDAVIRECKEEMGLDIDAEAHGLRPIHATDDYHTFAKAVDEKFHPKMNSEHSGYAWAALDMLPMPLHPGVKEMLEEQLGCDADMEPEEWESLRANFAKWTHEEEREVEHAQDEAVEPDWEKFMNDEMFSARATQNIKDVWILGDDDESEPIHDMDEEDTSLKADIYQV